MSRTLHLFGTDWCAMMVPIQVIRWYRMQCYDGTDSCAIVVPIRRYCHLYSLSQFLSILSVLQFSHKQHICLLFNQCNNCSTITLSNDCIHLKITKSHSINLLGSFADTHTIRYDNAFATYRSCTMFQSVTAIFIQRTSLFFVFPDYAIDTLRRDALAFLDKVARYLFRGPLLLF